MHFSRGGKMLLINALNNGLKELPNELRSLKTNIEGSKWSDEKKSYALEIVQQLNRPELNGLTDMRLFKVRFKPLVLTFSHSEIEGISPNRDMTVLIEYVKDILNYINQMSDIIYLSYGGHDCTCRDWKINIDWYI